MPLYDFQCVKCGYVRYDIFFRGDEVPDNLNRDCAVCKTETQFTLIFPSPAVDDWGNCGDGRFEEHLGPQGMHFTSKKKKQEYMKKNGLIEY